MMKHLSRSLFAPCFLAVAMNMPIGLALAQSAPGAASITSPIGAGQAATPTFSWPAVASATWYLLWVDDITGTRIQQWYPSSALGCATTNHCNITPGTALAAGAVTTWVQTWSNYGYGPWSSPASSTVGGTNQSPPGPTTISSPIGAGQPTTPTYAWNAVPSSSWYQLWVDDTTGTPIRQWYTAQELGCASASSECQITHDTALAAGEVTTWVQTWNEAGAGPWSAPTSSQIEDDPGGLNNCTAQTPPGSIKTVLVSPSNPVDVPASFMGLHRGLHTPEYLPNAYSVVPAPTYPYGFVRNLKAEVDGLNERGFWSTIEQSPGVYSWAAADQWVQENAGHPIIWMIYGTPVFYQKYPGEASRFPSWPGIASPPTIAGHAALAAFAQALKARYGSQIVAFEIWNEPTFPWTGGPTSYTDRWSPAWAQTHQQAPGFFSGSASDLADIAFTLNNANLGVPILGAAFTDSWETHQHSVTRFLNAPVTLPNATGTGKDHIQALSIHYYDYAFNPESLLDHVDGYQAKLANAGKSGMPIWATETGAEAGGKFLPNDARAPVNIQRWVLMAAAKRLKSMVLYGHFAGIESVHYLGDPLNNASTIQSLTQAFAIGGTKICNAAVLNDGRVWVHTLAGNQFLR